MKTFGLMGVVLACVVALAVEASASVVAVEAVTDVGIFGRRAVVQPLVVQRQRVLVVPRVRQRVVVPQAIVVPQAYVAPLIVQPQVIVPQQQIIVPQQQRLLLIR